MSGDTASWVQAAGVLAFASAVLYELRQLGPLVKAWTTVVGEVKTELGKVREVLSALLERDRIRAERRKEPSDPPPSMETWEDSTDIHDIIERQRRQRTRSPAHGVRTHARGVHHDKDD